MIFIPQGDDPSLEKLTLLDRIDMVCDQFEREWQAGSTPRVEEFITRHAHIDSDILVRELLALEIDYRQRRGDPPTIEELSKRFPQYETLLSGIHDSKSLDTRSSARDATPVTPPQQIGKLQLLDEVGRGGGGRVYRAYDQSLERIVAVKLAQLSWSRGDKHYLERFLHEARHLARLSHPGIVPVYDAGVTDAGAYIVSEFIEGRTLAEELAGGRRFSFKETALMMAQIADALDYAHRQGLVHRDLKPANIILQAPAAHHAEGQAENCLPGESLRPRLLDFGLARRDDAGTHLTEAGQILGTPGYMSPEQAAGQGYRCDARSDIYSLGVVLFELLTGRQLYQGSVPAVLRQILEGETPALRSRDRRIPKDLVVICHKCLEKSPDRRYASAADLAIDLRAWTERRPIRARAISPLERCVRWAWKRRWLAFSAAVILLLIVGSSAAVWRLRSAQLRLRDLDVQQLLVATPAQLPSVLQRVRENLPELRDQLTRLRDDASLTNRQRLLVTVAMGGDRFGSPSHLLPGLLEMAPGEFEVVRAELAPHAVALRPMLWQALLQASNEQAAVLRAACLLAHFDPDDPRWKTVADKVSWSLASAGEEQVGLWASELHPVRLVLYEALARLYQDEKHADQQLGAAQALGALYLDRTDHLCTLLLTATDGQFPILVGALQNRRDVATDFMRRHILTASPGPGDAMERATAADERRARQLATAVLAMIALGRADEAWQFWDSSTDPRLQTYLIHQYRTTGLSPQLLAERLVSGDRDPPGVQYALLLALGHHALGEFSEVDRAALLRWLLDNYQRHPDSGVHCAIRWLGKQWAIEDRLAAFDQRLIEQGVSLQRRWYLNRLGQVMVVVPKGTRYQMEPMAQGADGQMRRRAETAETRRAYAIAATETTWAEVERVTGVQKRPPGEQEDYPVSELSWFEAVQFACQVSELEQIPESDRGVSVVAEVPESATIDLTKFGYRLPTEEEWECAARAGTYSPRFFGEMQTPYLDRYVWRSSDQDNPVSVAGRCPNPWGLFDVYGNVLEWTGSPFKMLAQPRVSGDILRIESTSVLTHRGGSWRTEIAQLYSSPSSPFTPSKKTRTSFTQFGFRLARTLAEPFTAE